MTLRTALQQGTKLLEDGAVAVPRLTAEVLLAHALRQERVYLIAHADDELSELAWIHYGRYLHQRIKGVPTQYITKKQEFFGREFCVSPAVLIPRPETEHIVEIALQHLHPGMRAVDVGTGSGIIGCTLALERPGSAVWATDISEPALRVARQNAARLSAAVEFVCCDVLSAVAEGSLDMIISNPPYVGFNEQDGLQREVRDHEPHLALFAGPAGTEIYERIVVEAQRALRPGGVLIVELGYRSLDAVRQMLGSGWTDISDGPDLAGIPRVLSARWKP